MNAPPVSPGSNWRPLGRAVFGFCATGPRGPNLTPDGLFNRSSDVEIGESNPGHSSHAELEKDLAESAGARQVEIDDERCTFSFLFHSPSRGASLICGTPWAILDVYRDPVRIPDPRLDAEALFNKTGIVRISDEKAAESAKEYEVVRRATRMVWDRMLFNFDTAVSASAITLRARVEGPLLPFVPFAGRYLANSYRGRLG